MGGQTESSACSLQWFAQIAGVSTKDTSIERWFGKK